MALMFSRIIEANQTQSSMTTTAAKEIQIRITEIKVISAMSLAVHQATIKAINQLSLVMATLVMMTKCHLRVIL